VLGALLALSLFWNVYSLQFSRTHKTAEDLWVAALRSDQPQLREEAAKSLGTLGKSSPPTIDALISTLSDARPAVRQSAIDALMIAGNAARPATAELIHLRRRDESEEVRQKAGVALQKLEGAPSGSSVLFSILFWLFLGAIVAALVVLIMRNRSASRPPGNGR
jgi:HEAT repeat protein